MIFHSSPINCSCSALNSGEGSGDLVLWNDLVNVWVPVAIAADYYYKNAKH